MSRAILTVALILPALSLPDDLLAETPPETEWHVAERDGISVEYVESDARAAQRILEVAVERAPGLARDLGVAAVSPVKVYLAPSDEVFAELTRYGVPDWGVGCAFPDRGVVVLRSPLTVPRPLQMEDVVVHEIAHVAVGRMLQGVRVPRWFHEGVALTLAGEWRLPRSDAMVGTGAGGALLRLSDIAGAFPEDSGSAMLAYTESFYAVNFLMKESGASSVGEMVRAVTAAGSFESGLATLYGAPLERFEEDVVSSYGRRFGWGILLTRWNVLFAVLALLLLAGGLVRMARSRRKVREWEEEDLGIRRRSRRGGDGSTGWR